MKKKKVSLFIAGLLLLSVSGQVHAITLKERAQNIKEQAITLAKKGGAQSKKLWDKINFLGNAFKEWESAKKELYPCSLKHCKSEWDAYKHGPHITAIHQDISIAKLERCERLRCPNEFKRFNRARVKVAASAVGLAILVNAVIAGSIIGITEYQERKYGPSDPGDF